PIGNRHESQEKGAEGWERDPRDDHRPGDRGTGHPRQVQLTIFRHASEEDDRRPVEGETQDPTELTPDEREDEADGQHATASAGLVPSRAFEPASSAPRYGARDRGRARRC